MLDILILLFLAGWCMFLVVMLAGWDITFRKVQSANESGTGVSVVIAFRNEASQLPELVKSLQQQTYGPNEFILVNDHSTDSFREYLKHLPPNFVVLDLPEGLEGKKQALTLGISRSKHKIIVTTDADCRHAPDWLAKLTAPFANPTVKMVGGPVALIPDATFFGDIQLLEFASIMAVTAGSYGLQTPFMVNGANLAFRKSTFTELGGYADNITIPSGDDEFLMRKLRASDPAGLQYLLTPAAIVRTPVLPDVTEFILQRCRWAGKWRHQPRSGSRILAPFVVFVQLSFVYAVTGDAGIIAFLAAGGKIALEYQLLKRSSLFLYRKMETPVFIALEILYPVYALAVAIGSNVLPVVWKGRNYSPGPVRGA